MHDVRYVALQSISVPLSLEAPLAKKDREARKQEQKEAEATRAQTAPLVESPKQQQSQGSMAAEDAGQGDVSSPRQPSSRRARAVSQGELMHKLQDAISAAKKPHLLRLTELPGWKAEAPTTTGFFIWPPGQQERFRSYKSVIKHLEELFMEQQDATPPPGAGQHALLHAADQHACVICAVTMSDERDDVI